MENLIQTVSPNVIFKTQEDTKLEELGEERGIRNLKEKYDNLKQNAPHLGF